MDSAKIEVQPAYTIDAVLGEGAIWDAPYKRLLWVDIEKCLLHIFNPASGLNQSVDMGSRIGTVVPVDENRLLVALQTGIHLVDLQFDTRDFKGNPLQGDKIRFNDGKCDPEGRLWVGSIHMEGDEKKAALYKIDTDFSIHQILDNITNSNGLAWNSAGDTFYYIDTPTQQIQAFDYDRRQGTIANPRVVVKIPKEQGSPDGMTIDNQDRLWVALYGGSAVCCFDPTDGRQLYRVEVPAPNVTSCAFGGEDLDCLYITTAREGLDEAQLLEYPMSGCLFSARVPAKGVPANRFKLP